MLTQQENKRLTRVGPGTPADELLRCYWYPVAAASELARHPTKYVKILGEELMLFRDQKANVCLELPNESREKFLTGRLGARARYSRRYRSILKVPA